MVDHLKSNCQYCPIVTKFGLNRKIAGGAVFFNLRAHMVLF